MHLSHYFRCTPALLYALNTQDMLIKDASSSSIGSSDCGTPPRVSSSSSGGSSVDLAYDNLSRTNSWGSTMSDVDLPCCLSDVIPKLTCDADMAPPQQLVSTAHRTKAYVAFTPVSGVDISHSSAESATVTAGMICFRLF